MSGKLVPFGRYRGQPLDRMLDDKGYVEWLMQQDWFVRRFPDIHAISINWGNPEASQTPEHNAMQARFLDIDYIANVLFILNAELANAVENVRKRNKNNEVLYFCPNTGYRLEFKKDAIEVRSGVPFIEDDTSSYLAISKKRKVSRIFQWNGAGALFVGKEFEVDGWDVFVKYKINNCVKAAILKNENDDAPDYEDQEIWGVPYSHECRIFFELKPHVSDDYPTVLRQMKKNRERAMVANRGASASYALIAGSISSQVVTVQQIKDFFAASGFGVLVLDEHPQLGALRHEP